MADPLAIIGAIATIVGLIDLGKKLCENLDDMKSTFANAPETISQISEDISALGSVLLRLQNSLEDGNHHGLDLNLSEEARHDLHYALINCRTTYLRLQKIMEKFVYYADLAGSSSTVTTILSIKMRFRWMLEERVILKVQQSLQVQKATLNLTLTLTVNVTMAVVSQDTSQIKELLYLLADQLKRTNNLTSQSVQDIKPQVDLSTAGIEDTENELNHTDKGSDAIQFSSSVSKTLAVRENTLGSKDVGLLEDSVVESSRTLAITTIEPTSETHAHDKNQNPVHLTNEIPVIVQPPKDRNPGSEQDPGFTSNHRSINNTKSEADPSSEQINSTIDNAEVPKVIPAAAYQLLQRPEQACCGFPTGSPRSRSRSPGRKKRAIVVPGETLFQAARTGHKNIFLQVLKNGARIIETEMDGTTLLQAAVEKNHEDIVLALLFYGADPNAGGGFRKCPLLAAMMCGHKRMVPILLEAGADPNTPGVLQKAAASGDTQLVTLLLNAGSDINSSVNDSGTALQVAATTNNTELVRHLLEKKADPNITRPGEYKQSRRSPLHAAAGHRNAEMIRLLLNGGANPTEAPGILHWATELGVVEIIDLLLDTGLDINSSFNGSGTALQVAAIMNNTEVVRHLLEKKADTNITRPGEYKQRQRSPLHAAVAAQNPALLLLLFDSRAVVTTPPGLIHYATKIGNLDILEIILNADVDIDEVYGKSGTAAYVAAENGRQDVLKFLLDQGADPDVEGGWHKTPLRVAIAKGYEDCVKELLSTGNEIDL